MPKRSSSTEVNGIRVGHREVLDYFDQVDPDMAELVLDMIHKQLDDRQRKRAEMSARLVKARKAKGKKGRSEDGEQAQVAGRESREPREPNPNLEEDPYTNRANA